MIKIKDNIFNENKIIQISINEENNLEIDIEHNFPRVIKDTTLDDIEWNYHSKEIEYLYKSNQEFEEENNRLNKKLEELEEELEEEKKAWKDMLDSRDKLCIRISKAIEYINNYMPNYDFDHYNLEKLLKILKGEENE